MSNAVKHYISLIISLIEISKRPIHAINCAIFFSFLGNFRYGETKSLYNLLIT